MGEWHWNTYNIIYETSRQSRFEARYWMLGAGALGRPSGMVWGGRREEGSGWGTHVYLWQIHSDIWQNQYNIIKFKNKKSLYQCFKENFKICSWIAFDKELLLFDYIFKIVWGIKFFLMAGMVVIRKKKIAWQGLESSQKGLHSTFGYFNLFNIQIILLYKLY